MEPLFHWSTVLNALTLGAVYALIAVGYTMVYGIIKLINFAHGEVFMLGAFWALIVVGLEQATGVNLFVALVPAMLLCAGVGAAVDWTAYLSLRRRHPLADRLSIALLVLLCAAALGFKLTGDATHEWHSAGAHRALGFVVGTLAAAVLAAAALEKFGGLGRALTRVRSDRLSALITAIGMSLVLQNVVMLVFGAEYRVFPESSLPEFMDATFLRVPAVSLGSLGVGQGTLLGKELVIWVAAVLMMVGLHLLVTRTKIGTAMRACSMDQETAALMGISVDRVIAFAFVVGSAMAAVAGVLYAAKVGGNISFRMGYYPGLLAFAAAVLGGIGNIRGAMLGGVLIGFVQGFSGGTFSIPFLVMIAVLLVRPRGLLGRAEASRA